MKALSLRSVKLGLATLALSLVVACQSTPAAVQQTPVAGTPEAASAADYRLGPADNLRVTVFGHPDLSGEFMVSSNGVVSLPLIGDVKAEGLTLSQFQRETEAKLKDGYLKEPRVSAEVLNFRPYYILGEVNRPGEYPYTNQLTVLKAIATAGGFTYRANKREVMIKGTDDPTEERIQLTPNTVIEPGDTIRVLERIF